MKPAFEVKSARLDVLAVHLHTADLAELEAALSQIAGQYRELDTVPFILDVQDFPNPEMLDTAAVIGLFARYGMRIISLRHDDAAWAAYAAYHHLFFNQNPKNAEPLQNTAEPQPAAAYEPPPAPSAAAVESGCRPTVLVSTPVRTGQQVYAENSDLIVTGAVSQGAELIADGNIHIYAPMRGRALAGAAGNTEARIFIHSMQAELVSVAGIYRNFEQDLPAHLHKQPVQVSLQDNRLVISAIDAE
ncbi:septum site-determining protein MinC [Neisseria lisongii]|uniref:Probable septum site-determining protein MinC n=1 Tax=Neisseria lisongii TaxID=2912188 RepID=A0AAW5AN89_9NEIS|nr:septum site-determining protein MinC [Neisseria lisongii]MCF7529926.1 septum site-determining protein MinC [Neisseria lisongii]